MEFPRLIEFAVSKYSKHQLLPYGINGLLCLQLIVVDVFLHRVISRPFVDGEPLNFGVRELELVERLCIL